MRKIFFVVAFTFTIFSVFASAENTPTTTQLSFILENESNLNFKCNSWSVVLVTEVDGVTYLEHYEFNTAYYAYAFASLHNGEYTISYNPCGGSQGPI